MAQKKKTKNNKVRSDKKSLPGTRFSSLFVLPDETKKWILGVVVFILAIIVALSFFNLAGVAGVALMSSLTFLIGKAVFVIPLVLILGGLVFFNAKYNKFFGPTVLAIVILIVGLSGLIESLNPDNKQGGWIG